jgi:hypothetical protein
MGQILHFMFPNLWFAFFALAWVAVATFGSLISNHQERRNKLLNTLKTLSLVTFLVSWTLLAGWVYNGRLNPTGPIIAYVGALMMIVGDWLAFFIDKTVRSPGGVRGAFWKWVLDHIDSFRARVIEEARQSLHPAERKFMELERLERETIVISAPAPMSVLTQVAPPVETGVGSAIPKAEGS